MSSKTDLKFGVPRGSVSGPLLFTLHTTLLSSMIPEQASPHHLYADNSQLYASFASGDSAVTLNDLQAYMASVQSWMSTSKLKLNPYDHKTEFLLIGNKRLRSKLLSMFPIELFDVKNLTQQYLLGILEKYLTKISPFSYISSMLLMLLPYVGSAVYFPLPSSG